MRASKWRAKPVTIDGVRYASRTEARWICGRLLEVRAGVLKSVTLQPRYQLGDIAYRADAEVLDAQGNLWAEEVKGIETERFRLVRRLWPKYGPWPLHVIKRRGRGWEIEVLPGRAAGINPAVNEHGGSRG